MGGPAIWNDSETAPPEPRVSQNSTEATVRRTGFVNRGKFLKCGGRRYRDSRCDPTRDTKAVAPSLGASYAGVRI